MREAFGGVLNIFVIVVVLLLIVGILGFTVNYTKAFRMKNFVISGFENFEAAGNCEMNTACYKWIVEKAGTIGFSPKNDLSCPTNYVNVNGYYCYLETNKSNGKYVYTIQTQVDIDLPIINKIMGLSIFKIHGDTRVIKKSR